MVRTTVTVVIGVTDVSANVDAVDTWRNKQNSIGQCKLKMQNPGNVYGGVFSTNDGISITVDDGAAVEIWTGFVNDVKPYLSKKGVYTNELVVTGSDRGRYGADLYVTAKYEEQNGDEIIEKINILAGTPWTWAEPGASPNIKYECRRTYLTDAVREICDLMGWDSYITNAGVITLFAAGGDPSGVALLSDAGDVTNNLLSFEEYEQVAKGIRNWIEISAGSVKDHYTEENGVLDWSVAGAGAAVADDTAKYIWGRGSIYFTTVAAVSQVYLDFSALKYGYTPLDLSKPCQAKVFMSIERAGGETNATVNPYMIDGGANRITFTRKKQGAGSKGYTELVPDWTAIPIWRVLTYPLGDTSQIQAAARSGYWHGDVAFDWTDVDIIGFEYTHTEAGEVWIDGWSIPSLDAKDIVEDAGVGSSQALYGKRMFHQYKNNLKSMIEITDLATRLLVLKKDPVQKFKAVAVGQTGTLYAAQTVTVQAPQHGIAGPTDYIITKLHHKVRRNSITRGWDFTTTYDLVRENTLASRVSDNRAAERLASLMSIVRALQGGTMDDDILIGDAETGTQTAVEFGTPFPLDPNDGDLFDLTADLAIGAARYYGPARYWYDEAGGDWERNPITLQRNAFPAGTGEVLGDEVYRTDLDIWYRWTGAWTQMDVAATVISGTIGATQLKKGIQPFDSSVLVEVIRVVATAGVTFDFDQDNGAGKTEITASAGTPFSDFNIGDIILIQMSEDPENNATGEIVDTVNAGGAGITLTNTVVGGIDNADDETMIVSVTDGLKWTGANPAVWFADTTTQNIANGTVQGLALDDTYWAIFTVGANVTLTNTYANAVGDTVGIIARVTTATGREPFIFPVFTRQGSTTLDFLGAGVIDTILLTSEALIGKIMKSSDGVSWTDGVGDPGTIMTRYGIQGKGGGGVTQFFLDSTDGKGYFAAGTAWIDSSGLTLKSNAFDFMHFQNAAGNELVRISTSLAGLGFYIWPGAGELADMTMGSPAGVHLDLHTRAAGGNYGVANLESSNAADIWLTPASGIVETSGNLEPTVGGAPGGYKVGVVGRVWDEMHADDYYGKYHVETSTIALRPAAAVALANTFWVTREAAADAILWVCKQTVAGGYLWVLVVGPGAGGDMFTAVYDIASDGVVDNSERVGGRPEADFLLKDGSRDITGVLTPDGDLTRDLGTGARHFMDAYIKTVWCANGAISIGSVGSLYLGADNAYRWSIDDDKLAPIGDDTYDIGAVGSRVKEIFCVTLTEGDHVFTERTCAVCDEPFLEGDSISNHVISVGEEGTRTIPMHARCET